MIGMWYNFIMKILEKPLKRADLEKAENVVFGEFVKGVVDVKRELLAIDANLHADLEKMLLEDGSNQYDLWGINLYLDDEEDLIEFDSMINIRPAQGNRSRGVEDGETRKKIVEVVGKWVK